MKKSIKKFISTLLVLFILMGMIPSVVFAADKEIPGDGDFLNARISTEHPGNHELSHGTHSNRLRKSGNALPEYYNSNDLNYITSVKSQGAYGTCWAFAAAASCEANMIKNGLTVNDKEVSAKSLDLSEYHLSWFSYTNAYDALGMLTGDKTTPSSSFLKIGGNGIIASFTLMRWEGIASESTSALQYARANSLGLNSKYAYDYNVGHIQDCIWIPTIYRDDVKNAIMTYGAGTIGYYSDRNESYENPETGAYYYPEFESCNHDVTVVGWDDHYSKENFNTVPEDDGAWIVKNSWGTAKGDNGYFYISYYDIPSQADYCYFYSVESTENYDNNYQYDGTANISSSKMISAGGSFANIFTANNSETLEAVAICNYTAGLDYTLQIYKNVTDVPTSGTLAATQCITLPYEGYHTVKLDTPIKLNASEKFAVVFVSDELAYVPTDANGAVSYMRWTHASHPQTSYYKAELDTAWTELSKANFRIKAYTTNRQNSIKVIADAEKGSYTVDGSIINVVPANGYYLLRAQVTEGNATCSISSNRVIVNTDGECTVTLTFAAKKQYLINYLYDGENVRQISVFSGDEYSMPEDPNLQEGVKFVGWSAEEVEKEAAPIYFIPGDIVKADSNTNYFALFSFKEAFADNSEKTYYTTSVETASPKCAHSITEIRNAIDATCNTSGYTGDVYCVDCDELISEGSEIALLGHVEKCVYAGNDTHQVICAVCNEILRTDACTFENGFCSECGQEEDASPALIYDPDLSFSMNITAKEEIQVVYTIQSKKVNNFDSFYLEVQKNDVDEGPSTTTFGFEPDMIAFEPVSVNGSVVAYRATYTNIYAKMMGDTFTAALYATDSGNNKIHYYALTPATIKEKLYDMVYAGSEAEQALGIAMLNYGAEAQKYFNYDIDNLVNADLTEEQRIFSVPAAKDLQAISADKSNVTGLSISLKNKVVMTLTTTKMQAGYDNLELIVKDAATGAELDRVPATKVTTTAFQAKYDNIGAAKMRALMTFALYDGDTRVSNEVAWSIESYVAQKKSDISMARMVNAMLVYGDAVAAAYPNG